MRRLLNTLLVASALTAVVILSYQITRQLIAQGAPSTLTQTTLAAAQTLTATTVTLTTSTAHVQASSGNIALVSSSAGAFLIFVDNEAERVIGGAANVWQVQRGWSNTARQSHANAAIVWFGLEGQFQASDPPLGSCTSPVFIVPWINLRSGYLWLCKSSAWVPYTHANLVLNSDPRQTTLSP